MNLFSTHYFSPIISAVLIEKSNKRLLTVSKDAFFLSGGKKVKKDFERVKTISAKDLNYLFL